MVNYYKNFGKAIVITLVTASIYFVLLENIQSKLALIISVVLYYLIAKITNTKMYPY